MPAPPSRPRRRPPRRRRTASGASTPMAGACDRVRPWTSWSTSPRRSAPATSASTSRCRSASRPSTRPSAAACAPVSCCSSAARRAPARRRWPLQMARNIASGGQANVLYICFEHDEEYLLNRIIAMESALAAPARQDRRRQAPGRPPRDPRHVAGRRAPSGADLAANPRLRPVARAHRSLRPEPLPAARLADAHRRVENMRTARRAATRSCRATAAWSSSSTTCRRCRSSRSRRPRREGDLRGQRAQGRGAPRRRCPMISIVAADKEGLKASRLRNHHLRGSSAINYEADIILILNEKYQIVAKVNIEFNPYQAQRFRDWVVVIGREEPRRPGQRRPRVREALRVLLLRPQRPDGPGEAHRGAALQRLTATAASASLRRRPDSRGIGVTSPAPGPFPTSSRSWSRSRVAAATRSSSTRRPASSGSIGSSPRPSSTTSTTATSTARGPATAITPMRCCWSTSRHSPAVTSGADRSAGSRCATRRASTSRSCASPSATHTRRTSTSLAQVRPHRLVEIEHFFETYKLLEEKATDVVGWREVEEARRVLQDDRVRWQLEPASTPESPPTLGRWIHQRGVASSPCRCRRPVAPGSSERLADPSVARGPRLRWVPARRPAPDARLHRAPRPSTGARRRAALAEVARSVDALRARAPRRGRLRRAVDVRASPGSASGTGRTARP